MTIPKDFCIQKIDFNSSRQINQVLDLLNRVFPKDSFDTDWWNWKYRKNPFGSPLGWCAKHSNSDNLIGIRLFLPWKFIVNEDAILSYQAVDTATSPDWRGKGVFSSLTKYALKEIKGSGKMIFNFPNENSYFLYKQLGWNDLFRRRWITKLIFPKFRFCSVRKSNDNEILNRFTSMNIKDMKYPLKASKNKMSTYWTDEVITWRFRENPKVKYYNYHEDGVNIIFRLEKKSFFDVIRIIKTYDSITKNGWRSFLKMASSKNINFILYNGFNTKLYEIISKDRYSFHWGKGLNCVVNNINNRLITKLRLEPADIDFF